VLPALFSQPSVFLKLYIIKTLFHFLLRQSFHTVVLYHERTGGPHIPFLGMINSEHDDVIRGPLFSLTLGLPSLSPPLTATSAPSKRVFSHAGELYSEKRANLAVRIFPILMLMRMNPNLGMN